MKLVRTIYGFGFGQGEAEEGVRQDQPSVIKNCESFEFFVPLFAIPTRPRWANRSRGWISSSNGSVCLVSSESKITLESRTSIERLPSAPSPSFISSLN